MPEKKTDAENTDAENIIVFLEKLSSSIIALREYANNPVSGRDNKKTVAAQKLLESINKELDSCKEHKCIGNFTITNLQTFLESAKNGINNTNKGKLDGILKAFDENLSNTNQINALNLTSKFKSLDASDLANVILKINNAVPEPNSPSDEYETTRLNPKKR